MSSTTSFVFFITSNFFRFAFDFICHSNHLLKRSDINTSELPIVYVNKQISLENAMLCFALRWSVYVYSTNLESNDEL